MKKPIIVLILLFSLCILFSGCKNSKRSNKIPEKNQKTKNSKLSDYDYYWAYEKKYSIYEKKDMDLLDELSQEEIEENIENLYYFAKLTDLSFLKRFSHIKSLYINTSRFDNIEPLTYLHNIEELTITENNVVDISPIENLKTLKKLTLHDKNKITDITPIANLKNLISLKLSGNDKITDISPLVNLENLEELRIGGFNSITDISPVIKLKNLKAIGLYGCDGIKDISMIGNLKDLEGFGIGDCNNIEDVNFVFDLSNLKRLYLEPKNMPDLTQIIKLENLEYFDAPVALDKKLFNSLSKLKRLKKINVHYIAVKDAGILFELTDLEEILSSWDKEEKIKNIETVKKLLDGGADPNERINSGALMRSNDQYPYFLYGEITPLMQSRKPEITELLIKYGARVNDQDEYGRTALMISSFFDGYGEDDNLNAKTLIRNGADVNIKDNKGQTALYIAIVSENTASIKVLVDNGANVNLRDNRGLSPLLAANIRYTEGWASEILDEITKILIKAGAVMNDADKQKVKRIIDEEEEKQDLSIKKALNMTGGDEHHHR